MAMRSQVSADGQGTGYARAPGELLCEEQQEINLVSVQDVAASSARMCRSTKRNGVALV